MKIYVVGGYVRDKILGLEPNDIDYVVTGATPADMFEQGFKQVGADFPVFLHPFTGEEYALARKEVSTGPGYHDFSVEFGPDVTIQEDLFRRDFTINSIAMDMETGEYIDPLYGIDDLKRNILRENGTNTLMEDPIRILRAGRFLAKFPFLKENMRCLEYAPSLDSATPERVFLELTKALMSVKPSNFFRFLVKYGLAKTWFKEIHDMVGVPQTYKWHMEGDVFEHTMMVLDSAARANESLDVRFACLTHDFGKTTTPKDVLPSHNGHEGRGFYMLDDFLDRLKVPNELRSSSKLTARYHTHVHNFHKLNPKTKVKMFMEFKKGTPNAVDVTAKTAYHDNEGKLPYSDGYENHLSFVAEMEFLKSKNKLSNFYTIEQIMAMKPENRSEALYRALIKLL